MRKHPEWYEGYGVGYDTGYNEAVNDLRCEIQELIVLLKDNHPMIRLGLQILLTKIPIKWQQLRKEVGLE